MPLILLAIIALSSVFVPVGLADPPSSASFDLAVQQEAENLLADRLAAVGAAPDTNRVVRSSSTEHGIYAENFCQVRRGDGCTAESNFAMDKFADFRRVVGGGESSGYAERDAINVGLVHEAMLQAREEWYVWQPRGVPVGSYLKYYDQVLAGFRIMVIDQVGIDIPLDPVQALADRAEEMRAAVDNNPAVARQRARAEKARDLADVSIRCYELCVDPSLARQ